MSPLNLYLPQSVALFGNSVFADTSKVRIKIRSYGISVALNPVGGPCKTQRRHTETGKRAMCRWRQGLERCIKDGERHGAPSPSEPPEGTGPASSEHPNAASCSRACAQPRWPGSRASYLEGSSFPLQAHLCSGLVTGAPASVWGTSSPRAV